MRMEERVLEKNAVYTVEIDGVSSEGMGVARIAGHVVFIKGASSSFRGKRGCGRTFPVAVPETELQIDTIAGQKNDTFLPQEFRLFDPVRSTSAGSADHAVTRQGKTSGSGAQYSADHAGVTRETGQKSELSIGGGFAAGDLPDQQINLLSEFFCRHG